MGTGSDGIYLVLFSVMYWVLDSFDYTRDFTHVEFAMRIGTTGLMLYVEDNIDNTVLHWLSLISAGYYMWHFLRTGIVDRSVTFSWKYLCALLLSLVAVVGYIPPGIMLMFSLMEISNIFRFATNYIGKKKPHWVGGKVYTLCDGAFFVTWMYYRIWVALPVICRFAFLDDVWQMRTPAVYIRLVQLCVGVMVAIHIMLTWRLLAQAKRAFAPANIDRYRKLLVNLTRQV